MMGGYDVVNEEINRRLDKLEDRVTQVEKDQTETKVYVKQIFSILDELKVTSKTQITKDDLFKFMREQNESTSASTSNWQKWTLTIIAGTLFAAIGYFFGHKP